MKTPQKVSLARTLRRGQTDAEAKLWLYLQNRQFNGFKFRRQRSLGNFIVDFICFEERLIIEIDGGQHNQSPAIENDEQRTRWLENAGFQVIRFWNNDILENIDGVLEKIRKTLAKD